MSIRPKPKTPYQHLLEDVKKWAFGVVYPKRTTMFFYKKDSLRAGSWVLWDVYERTKAADTLGYDVKITAEEDGLYMRYVKRPDLAPIAVRP